MKRNPHFSQLSKNYLFQNIWERVQDFLQKNPQAQLINLGVGDTTEPLPELIAGAMGRYADALGTPAGYRGYGEGQGRGELRNAIATRLYHNRIDSDEIFISDGAKSAIGRLQVLFQPGLTVAVQDPTYPVPVESSIMNGHRLIFLPCTPENDFWPTEFPQADLIYICSPHNPTGTAATKKQLKKLVDLAKRQKSLLIFDTAYASYIQESDIPRSIYEIEGADEVAIELGSFSKFAGFTGVRLGWTIVPKKLTFSDGASLYDDYRRANATLFNGASNISEAGGLACLSEEGLEATQLLLDYYMANTAILFDALTATGHSVYGGVNAPYLWVHFPEQDSWSAFDELLQKTHLMTTPGVGFGPAGEGFLRFSAYGHQTQISEAAQRLTEHFGNK
ncbi:MAG: LL-diaminopimelate aminotransferase [Verrucomicrobia bacterium]|nr:LL-diaminopimelate aminotransferase [Verrucomicrobiota bacterium]